MGDVTNGTLKGKRGLKETIASLPPHEGEVTQDLVSATHRNNACYNCPYACNTFVKYREAADAMASTGVEEPGCMVTDLSGLMGFSYLGKDAPQALEKCFRLGLEPTAAAQLAKAGGSGDLSSTTEKLDQLAQSGGELKEADLPHLYGVSPWPLPASLESSLIQACGVFSNAVPTMPVVASFSNFGVEGDAVDKAAWWVKRQALAYVLGICPIFALTSPEVNEERLTELIKLSAEWEDFSVEKLQEIVAQTVKQSLQTREQAGKVHSSQQVEGFDSARNDLLARFS
jgi:hypothetical protein